MKKVYKEIAGVTIGWDMSPITCDSNGRMFDRKTEMIINKEYYPEWPVNKWPVDPTTGLKLPVFEYR